MATPDKYRIATLQKGLRVLQLFDEERHTLRLSEIAEATNMPVPTAFRYARTLQIGGLLVQADDGSYGPGPAVLGLGFAALRAMSLVQVARDHIQRLVSETSETVNMGVLIGSEVLYLIRIRNADLVTAAVQVGSSLPAACTSMGKLLLAYMSEQEVRIRIDEKEIGRCGGPNAYRSVEELLSDCSVIRERGWAVQDQQIAHGVRSLAAPIRDEGGQAVAAVNIAVQSIRLTTDELITKYLPSLLATAAKISNFLGYSN